MIRAALSPERMALVAGVTLRESLRQGMPALLAALAAALTGGAWLLRDLNFGAAELKFLMDAGFGAQAFFGAILAIVAPGHLFFAAVERRTVHLVLARPVRRTEFIFGQLGGVLLLLLGFCALLTLLLAGLLWWRETGLMQTHPGVFPQGRRVPYAGLAWTALVQWLRLGVLAAITLLVASYAHSNLFATMAGFSALVVCQLQHFARDFFGQMESPWARGGAWLVGLLAPDLRLVDVAEKTAAGEPLPAGLIGGITVYAVIYIGLFAALAAYCFRHRDL